MKRYFHSELEAIKNKLILLGEKTSEAARLSTQSFLESDIEKTHTTLDLDDPIDEMEKEIAHECERYITLRSPVSGDVRLILVAITASHNFERAADEAHSIAKKTKNIISRDGKIQQMASIKDMSEQACIMMQDAITCLAEEDIKMAQSIIDRDKSVDQLNLTNYEILTAQKMIEELDYTTRFETILISKSIERIADHAKNLAEEVIYLLTGK